MPGLGEKKFLCEHCGVRVVYDVPRLLWQHAFPARNCSDERVLHPLPYIGIGGNRYIGHPTLEQEAMWAQERDELLNEMERMRSRLVFELRSLFDHAVNNVVYMSHDRVASIQALLKEYA